MNTTSVLFAREAGFSEEEISKLWETFVDPEHIPLEDAPGLAFMVNDTDLRTAASDAEADDEGDVEVSRLCRLALSKLRSSKAQLFAISDI